jgi:hypothetical protein
MTPTPIGERERILAALTREPQTAPQLAKLAQACPCRIYQHLWWMSAQRPQLVRYIERPVTRKSQPRFFWLLPDAQAQEPKPQSELTQQAPALTQQAPAAPLDPQAPSDPQPQQPQVQQEQTPKAKVARGTRQDNKSLDRLAARRAEVAQAVKGLLETFGPMTFARLLEALGRAGQHVNESRLRDKIAGQEPCMAEAGVRYMARMGAWAVVYLPQQLAQAEALGKHLDQTPLRRRTAAWTPNPWARTTPAPAQITEAVTSPAEPTIAHSGDPDRRAPRLDSASLDPRREPPLVLPGASPLSPVAARAAAERLAKRATIQGLPWTYRPVVGLSGVWEIVESKRQEDHRLMGEDICERRLQRWAREGCPPRIDGLTPTGFSPNSKEAQP